MHIQTRAYRFRFYPTDEQKVTLARTFGCVRVAYNWGLRLKTDVYYKQQRRLYYRDLSSMFTNLKKQTEYSWLNEVSCVPTQQALRHLDKAFLNFFEKRGSYPTFKKKSNNQSAEYTRSAFSY